MISLGIICYQGHSSAAALVCDGTVMAAVAEERFTRKKFDDSFPEHSIAWLLKEFNLGFQQINHVAVGWCPRKTLLGQLPNIHRKSLSFLLEKRPGGSVRSRLDKFLLISNLKNEFKKRYDFQGKFSFVDHHLSHAVSAFIQSGKNDCVVMVADGMGETASTTLYEFKDRSYKILHRDLFPNSLGIFYSAATQFLGFIPDSDEYKVMGMAAYSQNEKFHKRFSELYYFEGSHFKLNMDYFDIHKKANQFYSNKYAELFADIRTDEDKTSFAYSLQTHLNKIVIEILKRNCHLFSSRNFASSGGVFLNCLLNQQLRSSELFESYCFFPIADDNGTAVGAAQFVQLMNEEIEMKKIDHLFLGPTIGTIDESLLENFFYKKIADWKEVATLLSKGNVIAWAQGRMEFGHRSLGNRSILASPLTKEMKNIINQKVKMREPFRPFAPSVLQENASEYFELGATFNENFPFMIETFTVKEKTKVMAPAIVHEDGTSRVQTVSKSENLKYHDLIKEFFQLTGCPILLNTSFNVNGMPIVLSASDALDCFIHTQIDYLVLEEYLIWKK